MCLLSLAASFLTLEILPQRTEPEINGDFYSFGYLQWSVREHLYWRDAYPQIKVGFDF